MDTSQRVVLITGAGSGMGRQVGIELARRGWMVAGLDQNEASLAELETDLAKEQRRFAWAVANVTDADTLSKEVAKFISRLGPIDLLIASAGIAGETPAVGMNAGAIAHIIGINLIGVSNTIAAVLPAMLARRSGHVVAISSLASFRGLPGQMGYCASKAGLNALMQSLWLDVKSYGIHVTTICPGHTRTPQAVDLFKEEYLLSVEEATREILKAIDRRKRFHAFPRVVARRLRLLRLLPAWLAERILVRIMRNAKKG